MAFEAHDIDWWLGRIEDVKGSGSGWSARCPAHSDPVGSLSLTIAEDGEVLVNCFAGCKYVDILKAVEDQEDTQVALIHIPTINTPAGEWWEQYTGVPITFWEEIGVVFSQRGVEFTWSGTPVVKIRVVGVKQFAWLPSDIATPPLWPSIPDRLDDTIYLCEGESDTGILRYAGLPAWGVTKGSLTPRLDSILPELKKRGVRRIISMFDFDSGGDKGSALLARACADLAIRYVRADLSRLVDPLLGEKDVRDVWRRERDKQKILSISEHFVEVSSSRRYLSVDGFLGETIQEAQWYIRPLVLKQTIQMIVGAPKRGKSWLALDLGISIASGTKFLGHFEVNQQAPVVIITKEDPDYLLQDRLRKIITAKGHGGSISQSSGKFSLMMPTEGMPLFLDLNRDFMFDDASSASLLAYLEEIEVEYGSVGMVIFDPTLRMISGVDEFKASEIASSVFRVAEKIQSRFHSGVVLVHHKSKGGGEMIKQSYGSMAFHAFSEGTWYLGEEDAEGWIPVKAEFKSARETEFRYRFVELETAYNVQVDEEVPVSMSSTRGDSDLPKKILVLLEKIPTGMNVGQISEAIPGSSDYMVRNALKLLDTQKKVERKKDLSPTTSPGAKSDLWYLTLS